MALRPPIEPMLAAPVKQLPENRGAVYEPKWDGWRCLAFRDDRGTVALYSRAGKPLTSYFPDITRVVANSVPVGTVLDGELLVFDPALGRTSFVLLQRRRVAGRRLMEQVATHPAHYVVFDLLADTGTDLRDKPLHERRTRLESLLSATTPTMPLSPQTDDLDVAQQWLSVGHEVGIEGVVIKDRTSKYRPGQRGWRKFKARSSIEVIIGGVTGTIDAPMEVLFGRRDATGRLRYMGRTAPVDPVQRKELSPLLTPARQPWRGSGGHPWPRPLPASWSDSGFGPRAKPLPYIQVETTIVAEIELDTTQTADTRPRHGTRFLRARLDMNTQDVPLLDTDPDER